MKKYAKYILYNLLFALPILLFTVNAFSKIDDNTFADNIQYAMSLENMADRRNGLLSILKNADQYQSFVILPYLAKADIFIKDYDSAKKHAEQIKLISNTYINNWNYGNAMHAYYTVMGMISFSEGSIEDAKDNLLKSADVPTSPQLSSFGPSMILADSLLKKGEINCVISYLRKMKAIWKNHHGRLDSWISSIKGGGKPYFGPNLNY